MTEEELKKLFEYGDCLTFDYTSTLENFSYYAALQKSCKKTALITSKMSVFALEKPLFHYFNNGVLVCSMFAPPEMLGQFKKLLRKKRMYFPCHREEASEGQ